MSYEILEEHYEKNFNKLVKRLAWRAGDVAMAEDIVQEAYTRAMKYYKSFDGDIDDFGRWHNTILVNALKEMKNKEKGYSPIESDAEEETYDCPSYVKHMMRDVYELISTKSAVQIEVLMLYFQQEYTARNICEITEYSYSMCHQIIQRFRNELRELYQRE